MLESIVAIDLCIIHRSWRPVLAAIITSSATWMAALAAGNPQ
jgi:hypothetical protein